MATARQDSTALWRESRVEDCCGGGVAEAGSMCLVQHVRLTTGATLRKREGSGTRVARDLSRSAISYTIIPWARRVMPSHARPCGSVRGSREFSRRGGSSDGDRWRSCNEAKQSHWLASTLSYGVGGGCSVGLEPSFAYQNAVITFKANYMP